MLEPSLGNLLLKMVYKTAPSSGGSVKRWSQVGVVRLSLVEITSLSDPPCPCSDRGVLHG